MPQNERIGVVAELDLRGWNTNVRKLQKDADKIDDSLQDAADSVNDFSDELGRIRGDTKVDIKTNVSDNELRTLRGDIDSLDNQTINLDVNAVRSEFNTLQGDVDSLDNEVVDIKTNADDEALDTILGKLDAIHTLALIDVVFNIADTDLGGVPIVGDLIEMNTALAELEGSTGRLIPQAEELIVDLYTNGWGESRGQIAGVIGEASRLGISMDDIDEAVHQAFYVSAIPGAGDTFEILRSMDQMVKTGLAPDFSTAADILVVGMQTGSDRGQDLLDTFNEYGSTFAEVGVSGKGALGLINSGLKAGVDNSDRIADALRETGVRLREINTDPNISAALDRLDSFTEADLRQQVNMFNAGELSGDEFWDGFLGAFGDAFEADPLAAAEIQATLIGTISEDFGPSVLAQLSPQWDDAMGELEGRAETAGNTISNNLGTALDTLRRTIEQGIIDVITDQFDIDQLIEDVKAAAATLTAELHAGKGLAEALEITFNLEGFADSVRLLESIMGNFLLVLSDIAIGVANIAGHPDTAASLQRLREPFVIDQLRFDLQTVEGADQIESVIRGAAARGIDSQEIVDNVALTMQEMRDRGDLIDMISLLGDLSDADLGQLSQFADETANLWIDDWSAAFTRAFEAGDFDFAGRMLGAIEDTNFAPTVATGMRAQLEFAFQDAMATADFQSMRGIADALDDPFITQQLQTQEQLFQGIAQGALNAGNYLDAVDYAQQIGDVNLLGQSLGGLSNQLLGGAAGAIGLGGAAPLGPGAGGVGGVPQQGGLPAEGGTIFDKISAGIGMVRGKLDTETPLITAKLGETAAKADETGTVAEEAFGRAEAAIIGLVATGVAQLPILIGLATELNNVLQGAFESASALGFQGIGGNGTHDAGGPLEAGQAFSIRDEAFISPFDAYALGTNTSSILNGLRGGGGGSISNRSANINITITNNGAAGRAMNESNVSNLIRGFA